MPNWCEGNIRIRGTADNVISFFRDEIEVAGHVHGSLEPVSMPPDICGDEYEIVVKCPEEMGSTSFTSFYIKGTRRNFIEGQCFDFYVDHNKEKQTVCIDGFRAAWYIDAGPYIEKARKYRVDVRIVGFERGMEFVQDIEIVDGELVKDEEIEYDDWKWECILPNMGG